MVLLRFPSHRTSLFSRSHLSNEMKIKQSMKGVDTCVLKTVRDKIFTYVVCYSFTDVAIMVTTITSKEFNREYSENASET